MKKGTRFLAIIFIISILFSCSKGNVDEEGENCFVCSTELESIDVCEEDGDFVVDGNTIDNPNNASLEEFIRAIEANPDNDPALEGISCRRK